MAKCRRCGKTVRRPGKLTTDGLCESCFWRTLQGLNPHIKVIVNHHTT